MRQFIRQWRAWRKVHLEQRLFIKLELEMQRDHMRALIAEAQLKEEHLDAYLKELNAIRRELRGDR